MELIFLVILGMITTLSLPPFNLFFLNFLTFPLFFIFLIKKSNLHNNLKFFFIYGWAFGFGYFMTNLYWISISLTFDQNFKFLIPLTVIFIPAFLSIFYGLVTIVFMILNPKKKNIKFFFYFFSNFWYPGIHKRVNIYWFSLELDCL